MAKLFELEFDLLVHPEYSPLAVIRCPQNSKVCKEGTWNGVLVLKIEINY